MSFNFSGVANMAWACFCGLVAGVFIGLFLGDGENDA